MAAILYLLVQLFITYWTNWMGKREGDEASYIFKYANVLFRLFQVPTHCREQYGKINIWKSHRSDCNLHPNSNGMQQQKKSVEKRAICTL